MGGRLERGLWSIAAEEMDWYPYFRLVGKTFHHKFQVRTDLLCWNFNPIPIFPVMGILLSWYSAIELDLKHLSDFHSL